MNANKEKYPEFIMALIVRFLTPSSSSIGNVTISFDTLLSFFKENINLFMACESCATVLKIFLDWKPFTLLPDSVCVLISYY